MAEEHVHTEFPAFTSQFRSARLLITQKQYLTVPSLTLGMDFTTQVICLFCFIHLLAPAPFIFFSLSVLPSLLLSLQLL